MLNSCVPSLQPLTLLLLHFAEGETETQRIPVNCLKVTEQSAEPSFQPRSFNSRASEPWLSLVDQSTVEDRGPAERNSVLEEHRIDL